MVTTTRVRRAHDETPNPPLLIDPDSWIEAAWMLEFTAPNIDMDPGDRCGDQTHRIVATVPYGAEIRASMMAVLYQEGNASPLTLTIRFRYWGSASPDGADDVVTQHHWTVVGADLDEVLTETTQRIRSVASLVAPQTGANPTLLYAPIRGGVPKFLTMFGELGYGVTPLSDESA